MRPYKEGSNSNTYLIEKGVVKVIPLLMRLFVYKIGHFEALHYYCTSSPSFVFLAILPHYFIAFSYLIDSFYGV